MKPEDVMMRLDEIRLNSNERIIALEKELKALKAELDRFKGIMGHLLGHIKELI